MLIVFLGNNSELFRAKSKRQMPYKKQKAIRSNKKDVIYDLMTDLGSSQNRTQHHEANGGKGH